MKKTLTKKTVERKHTDEELLIISGELKSITRSLKVINCKHKWEKHGFGYQCTAGCDDYTGTHHQLNKMIEKELTK